MATNDEYALTRPLSRLLPTPRLYWHWQWVFFAGDATALGAVAFLNRDVSPWLLLLFTFTVFALFWAAKLYRPVRRVSVLDQGPTGLSMVSMAAMVTLTADILVVHASFTSDEFLRLWLAAAILTFAGRSLALPVRLWLIRRAAPRRALIVGSGQSAVLAAQKMDAHPEAGLALVGFVDDGPRQSVRGRDEPLLGPIDQLEKLIERFDIQTALIAFVKRGHHEILEMLYRCQPKVEVLVLPRYFEYLSSGVEVDALGNLPVLKLQTHRMGGVSAIVKRLEDVLVASTMLVLTAPLWAILAIAIRLDSPGPVVYRSRRVGRDLRQFDQLKFRTMRIDADKDGQAIETMKEENARGWKLKDDPRITRVGRFLRRSSLDELPQLINILTGEMSFVGPRPALVGELEQYEEWHRKRLSVRPGLTGLWQVSGRSDLPFDERIWLDFYYIDEWSLWLDFKIIIRTVGAVVSARGAY